MQWQDVLADESLQDLPYKIELNEQGNIEMSPASLMHSYLQATFAEMQDKVLLYLEAGAIEVWLVEQKGLIRFFNVDGEQKTSCFTNKITTI